MLLGCVIFNDDLFGVDTSGRSFGGSCGK